MTLSGNRRGKALTIVSVVVLVGLAIGIIFHLKSKSENSGLVTSTTEKQKPKTDEWTDQAIDGIGGEDIPKVREVANAYVQAQESGCSARGFSSTSINGNLYFVAVDLTCDKTRKTLNLVARRFYTLDQESSYWKADLLSRDVVGLALTERQAETSQDR